MNLMDDMQTDTPPSENQTEGASPLLLQDMQFTEEAMSMPVGKGRSRSAMVAVLVVVAAIGALFAMRQLGLGPALSLAEVTVEYTPEESAKATVASGKVLADLERSRRAVQVPAENITQDPFELNANKGIDDSPKVDPDLARKAELERQRALHEARLAEIEKEFGQLSLQSVMLGSRPVARINGEIYKIGMTVGEHFIVTGIEGREVKLFADDQTYILSLDDQPKRPGSKRNR